MYMRFYAIHIHEILLYTHEVLLHIHEVRLHAHEVFLHIHEIVLDMHEVLLHTHEYCYIHRSYTSNLHPPSNAVRWYYSQLTHRDIKAPRG